MFYRTLGDSGLTVSVIGLGCPNFGGPGAPREHDHLWGPLGIDEARPIIGAALDAGITLFDLADLHAEGRAEIIVGQLLHACRDEIVISTKWGGAHKIWNPDIPWGAPEHVRTSVESSLIRLNTDYIDIYTYHWHDGRTPIEETISTLDELVREGKIRQFGHSHFTAWQSVEAAWIARTNGWQPFASAQNRYHLLDRKLEEEMFPACAKYGVGILSYFPLAKGLLTGKYSIDNPPPGHMSLAGRVVDGAIDDHVWNQLRRLRDFAIDRGHDLAELAIAFCVARPEIACVLTGASRADQVLTNANASDWLLTPEELVSIDSLLESPSDR